MQGVVYSLNLTAGGSHPGCDRRMASTQLCLSLQADCYLGRVRVIVEGLSLSNSLTLTTEYRWTGRH